MHVFQDCVEGVDEGGFPEADVVRQGDDPAFSHPGHGFHVFGEAAAVGREASGQTCCLVLFTLREKAAFAIKAFAARNVMKTHHAVAELPFRHAAASDYDSAP